jgi:hypothetical protein
MWMKTGPQTWIPYVPKGSTGVQEPNAAAGCVADQVEKAEAAGQQKAPNAAIACVADQVEKAEASGQQEADSRCCARRRLCAAFLSDADKVTKLGVSLSMPFFFMLQSGQIVENVRNPKGMEGLRWNFFAAGALGFLVLSTFMCKIGEVAQARNQIFGAIITLTPMIQMFAYRGKVLVPHLPFFFIVVIITAGVVILVVRLCGRGQEVFATWMHIATIVAGGLVGYTVEYEVLYDIGVQARFPEIASASEGAITLAGFAVVLCMVVCKRTTDSTGGWLAIFLFTYMPLPQIWENCVHPESAAGFSILFIYCNMMANGPGLARALYIRNAIWISFAGWACFVKGVLLSATVLIANARLTTSFLTPLRAHMLIAFNGAFLFYATVLFTSMVRTKPLEEPQNEETTCKGAEASV